MVIDWIEADARDVVRGVLPIDRFRREGGFRRAVCANCFGKAHLCELQTTVTYLRKDRTVDGSLYSEIIHH